MIMTTSDQDRARLMCLKRMLQMQAMDRAHRIGQKKEVQVFRFCTEMSIEEKVSLYTFPPMLYQVPKVMLCMTCSVPLSLVPVQRCHIMLMTLEYVQFGFECMNLNSQQQVQSIFPLTGKTTRLQACSHEGCD